MDRAEAGAVKVTNRRGCLATVSGTPLPPRSPAARSWKLSAWWVAEQEGHTDARRLPHAFSRVASRSRLVE
jgi:hypothetical protein